jgi:hypothetical protein
MSILSTRHEGEEEQLSLERGTTLVVGSIRVSCAVVRSRQSSSTKRSFFSEKSSDESSWSLFRHSPDEIGSSRPLSADRSFGHVSSNCDRIAIVSGLGCQFTLSTVYAFFSMSINEWIHTIGLTINLTELATD